MGGQGVACESCAGLQEALALEMAKNDVLLGQVVENEDAIARQDVAAFGDVIPNADRASWHGKLIENRAEALGQLTRLRGQFAAADGKPPVPRPLHNRAAARPVVALAAPGKPGGAEAAVKLRNRANELEKTLGCSFSAAWARAEKELGA